MNMSASEKSKLNVAAMISSSWKKATPSVRVYYYELAAQDKFRYYNEKNEYRLYLSRARSQESQDEPPSPVPQTLATKVSKGKTLSSIKNVPSVVSFEQQQEPAPYENDQQYYIEPEEVGSPYYCSKRAIADLASRLDAESIDFLIRAFK